MSCSATGHLLVVINKLPRSRVVCVLPSQRTLILLVVINKLPRSGVVQPEDINLISGNK